jgi:P-aminobenzoate N-oxygenase AurF
MKKVFEVEWMGGAAEHHFRKARPAIEELPWGTLDPSAYAPAAVDYARGAWTEVAINEYRAVASFTEVLRALVDVQAPLDLIGMTSDFLADECSHVEMASRVAMELGGAAPRLVDMDRFASRPRGLTHLQRANELVLRVSCIAEAFSGGTATVSHESTSHPLTRAVYAAILRDEARHRRLGGLYFEWALARIDPEEFRRLGRVTLTSLQTLAPFWKPSPARVRAELPAGDLQALGWLAPARFGSVARAIVVRDILDPLATIGIAPSEEERADLLGPS